MDHSQQPQVGRAATGSPAPEQQPKGQPDQIMDQPREPEKQEGQPQDQQPVMTVYSWQQ